MTEPQVLSERVYQFWRTLDLGEYHKTVSLLAANCIWHREVVLQGQDAILNALESRPANMLTRHQINNLRIIWDDVPTAQFLITTFGAIANKSVAAIPDCGGPAAVVDVEMRFTEIDKHYLITEIRNQLIFLRPQS